MVDGLRIQHLAGGVQPGGASTDPVALEDARHQREIARIRAEADAAVSRTKAEAEAREAAEERRRARERDEHRQEREAIEAREESRWKRESDERRREREEREATEERRWKAELEERREARDARGDPIQQFSVFAQLIESIRGGGDGDGDGSTAGIIRAIAEAARVAVEGGKEVVLWNEGRKSERGGPYDPKSDLLLQGQLAAKAKGAYANLKRAGKSDREIQAILGSSFDMLARAKLDTSKREPPKKPAPKVVSKPNGKPKAARVEYQPPPKATPKNPKTPTEKPAD